MIGTRWEPKRGGYCELRRTTCVQSGNYRKSQLLMHCVSHHITPRQLFAYVGHVVTGLYIAGWLGITTRHLRGRVGLLSPTLRGIGLRTSRDSIRLRKLYDYDRPDLPEKARYKWEIFLLRQLSQGKADSVLALAATYTENWTHIP